MLIIENESSIELKMKCENPPRSNKLKIKLTKWTYKWLIKRKEENFETQPEALMIEITHFMSFVNLNALLKDDKAVEVVNNFINFLFETFFVTSRCKMWLQDAELIWFHSLPHKSIISAKNFYEENC